MGCSQTLSQQNTAMKAALVTLQKKIKGYDAQIAELVQDKDSLHSKVSSSTAEDTEIPVQNNSALQSGICRSGQLRAGQANTRHSCTKRRTSWQAVKHSSRSRLCAYGMQAARLCSFLWLECSQAFYKEVSSLKYCVLHAAACSKTITSNLQPAAAQGRN